MSPAPRVSCALCVRSEETTVTGALLTKEDVTAHQKCLLYASGIFCQSSPEFDDLFGFSVSDVKAEVKRGKRLLCGKCNKKGATAGCEVKRCKKSYHYPCAIEDDAKTMDGVDEKYGLYCPKHCEQTGDGAGVSNGFSTSPALHHSEDPTEPGPSEAEAETEGNIPLDHVSNGITLSYCDQHAPSSHKENTNGDSTSARLSSHGSDSNSNSGISKKSSRKRLSIADRLQEPSAKSTPNTWNRRITDNSSDSDEDLLDEYMAPIESDWESQEDSHRKSPEAPTGPPSGSLPQITCDDDTGDETDVDSESLLQPAGRGSGQQSPLPTNETASQTESPAARIWKLEDVEVFPVFGSSIELSQDQHLDGPSVSDQSSIAPPASSDLPNGLVNSPPGPISPALPDATPPPAAPPSDPEPDVDAGGFWRSCNAAGCTRALFTDFIQEIIDVSSRIQSEEASQEDYDLALKVMKASGKLEELVTRQQKELERKQMELQQAAASMQKVVSAMQR